MDTLIILGAGGHGKVAADIAIKMDKYKEILFLDDTKEGQVMGLTVAGKISDYAAWRKRADYFVAIGNSKARADFIEQLLNDGESVATLIHPCSCIGEGVSIGHGTVVMAGAVINPDAAIGTGAIINTASSVDHDCTIGDYCHISVGAHLAGTVTVGSHTMIGAGATVINNVTICENCMIGAGAVVISNIETEGTYIGVPARVR